MPITRDEIDSPLLEDYQQSFTGGQVSNAVPIQLAENQAFQLTNCEISLLGQVETRRGTDQLGNDVGSGTKIRGMTFARIAGTDYPIAISDTVTKYLNGATWNTFSGTAFALTNTTQPVSFAPGNGYVYAADGGSYYIRRADGTVWTQVSSDSAPQGVSLLIYHTNRLIASGQSSAPDAIYFSGILDDTLWSSLSGGYQIQIAGDGVPITAMVGWSQNNIAVFKQNSTWLVGADPLMDVSDMPVQQIHAHIGCVAARSAVQVGADILFLSGDGVRSLNQTIASDNRYELGQPLSFPIQDVMNRINQAAISKSSAVYWKGKYILSVPIDSATEPNYLIVYDAKANAWSGIWSNLEVACFSSRIDSGVEKLMMGLSDDNQVVEYLDYVASADATDDTYTDYDNSPVLMAALTRGMIFGDLHSMKKGFSARIVFNRSRGNADLKVILDEGKTLDVVSLDTGGSGGFEIPFDIPFDIGRIGLQPAALDLFQYPEFYIVQFQVVSTSVGRKELRQITAEAFPEATDFRGNFSD